MGRLYIACEPGDLRLGPFVTRDGAVSAAVTHAIEQGARDVELSFTDQHDLALFELRGPGISLKTVRGNDQGKRRGAPTLVAGWARVVGRKEIEVTQKRLVALAGEAALGLGRKFFIVGLNAKGQVERAGLLGDGSQVPKNIQPSLHYAKTMAAPGTPAYKALEHCPEVYIAWTASGKPMRAVFRRSKA